MRRSELGAIGGGLILFFMVLASCTRATTVPTLTPAPTVVPTADSGQRLAPRAPALQIPAVATRLAQIDASLKVPLPIISLLRLDDTQRLALNIAVRDTKFTDSIRNKLTREPLRNEVFSVSKLKDADLAAPQLEPCRTVTCYRVEMYEYAFNATTIAVVDVVQNRVISVIVQPDTQPEIPPHLADLAVQIAINSPEVKEALGFNPTEDKAGMANVKTALNGSRCERSRHLCVAPTFIVGGRALWAIVDLTDAALVGVRWTDLGESSNKRLTEKSLQDDVVTTQYCDHTNVVTRDGWTFNYVLTLSDGIRVSNAKYNGQPVIKSSTLVDWHVSYSTREGFGYSDAVGCPTFSSAAVIAFNGPYIEDIKSGVDVIGFTLVQEYRSKGWPQPCNYSYQQRDEFYTDGRFRIVATSLGRGCGNDGMYRPVTRIQLAETTRFSEWSGTDWTSWTKEGWQLQKADTAISAAGFQYRVTNEAGRGYYVMPNSGQLGANERGDAAYVYVTVDHPDKEEGTTDLLTIGPCCNTDYHQGPEKFIEPAPEALGGSPIVVWYVAQLKNDDRPGNQYCWADAVPVAGVYVPKVWPCSSGAMFVPIPQQ